MSDDKTAAQEGVYWKVTEEMSENCAAFSVERRDCISVSGLLKAFVKWDGCTNLLFRDDDCYVHSCDLDQLINELLELREMAHRRDVGKYEGPR